LSAHWGDGEPGSGHPARTLAALWGFLAVALLGWAALTGPWTSQHAVTGTRNFGVLDHRPAGRVLTLRVHWDAPGGASGWVALEPGHPWAEGVGTYCPSGLERIDLG
jgi:hypothetical protein